MQFVYKLHINYSFCIKFIKAHYYFIHEANISNFDSKFVFTNKVKKDIIIEKLNEVFRVVLKGKNRTMVDCKC